MAGCGQQPVDPKSLIACQLAGAETFARNCTIDRSSGPDGTILTIHHPDGGFRRLLVATDGQGVDAADGASHAEVRLEGDREIEVLLDGDRYRLPAKRKDAKGKP